jgi:hypothetical protein
LQSKEQLTRKKPTALYPTVCSPSYGIINVSQHPTSVSLGGTPSSLRREQQSVFLSFAPSSTTQQDIPQDTVQHNVTTGSSSRPQPAVHVPPISPDTSAVTIGQPIPNAKQHSLTGMSTTSKFASVPSPATPINTHTISSPGSNSLSTAPLNCQSTNTVPLRGQPTVTTNGAEGYSQSSRSVIYSESTNPGCSLTSPLSPVSPSGDTQPLYRPSNFTAFLPINTGAQVSLPYSSVGTPQQTITTPQSPSEIQPPLPRSSVGHKPSALPEFRSQRGNAANKERLKVLRSASSDSSNIGWVNSPDAASSLSSSSLGSTGNFEMLCNDLFYVYCHADNKSLCMFI